MHGKRLTQHLKDEGAAVARKFGFRDNDLWNSFLYFFAVLIKHQPSELRSSSWKYTAWAEIEPEPHEAAFLDGSYVTAQLDTAWRTRSKKSAELYQRLFADTPLRLECLGPCFFFAFSGIQVQCAL